MYRFAPLLFVFLWSTGFIGARFGLPHAGPLSFLFVRYLLVITLLGLVVWLTRAPWPTPRQAGHIGVAGLLLHCFYLGGVFTAIACGLPAGITALIVGLQPLLTAAFAGWLLGEQVTPRQWLGLVLGLAGVGLVVGSRFGLAGAADSAWWPALVALASITAGTLYQKRFCPHFDLRSGTLIQFLPTAFVTGLGLLVWEDFRIEWTGEFIFALTWLTFVLSLGAIALLNLLIRQGSAVNVASLFYLTPPTTALIAWWLLDEKLMLAVLAGMALAATGVYLAVRRPPPRPTA